MDKNLYKNNNNITERKDNTVVKAKTLYQNTCRQWVPVYLHTLPNIVRRALHVHKV